MVSIVALFWSGVAEMCKQQIVAKPSADSYCKSNLGSQAIIFVTIEFHWYDPRIAPRILR